MALEELQAMFEKHKDEFLKFDRVNNPAHRRPDLCAFLMLDAAVDVKNARGGYSAMVSAAEHDEIYLVIDAEELAKVATDDLVRDLIRCGVLYDSTYDCLAMFT